MKKWTPGPWKTQKMNRPIGHAEWEIHWSDDGECVADVVYEEADAKLMAAAPELYAELNWIVENLDLQASRLDLSNAKQALAKARGEGDE